MTGASAMRYRMNTVMLCLATNRSKHGGQAADPRTDHGGFLDRLVRPGGNQSRNGEKDASRVAATRSRSRNRRALMVATDRDTPGIRATHCAKPMITASFRLSEDSGRSRLPTRSAIHITALQAPSATTTAEL